MILDLWAKYSENSEIFYCICMKYYIIKKAQNVNPSLLYYIWLQFYLTILISSMIFFAPANLSMMNSM